MGADDALRLKHCVLLMLLVAICRISIPLQHTYLTRQSRRAEFSDSLERIMRRPLGDDATRIAAQDPQAFERQTIDRLRSGSIGQC